jgi:hypothetical protein
MKKYRVYITYKETRQLDVKANSPEEAEEIAYDRADEAEPVGDDDYEYEVEEIDE